MSPPLSRKRCSVNCLRLGLSPQGSRPWASLPEDLVQLIGWRVLAADLLDYVRLRAVCAHWNRSTIRPRGLGLVDPRFHPRRWMLLPEGHGLYPGHPHLGGYVRFFNLSTGVYVRCHLPLLHDHIILDSIDGLLLLLLLHRDHGTDIRLLHPFTGDIAELPPLLSLLPQIELQARYLNMSEDQKLSRLRTFLRGVPAAVTVSDARTITVMLVLRTESCVALATAGDERWTLSAWKLPLLAQAVFFQGKMYTVSRRFREKNVVFIYQIDPPQLNFEDPQSLSLHPPTMIAKCPLVGTIGSMVHLVECGLELMLVGRNGRPASDVSGPHLVVYRVADLVCGRIALVKDIGDHALFLGNRSVFVSANKGFPSVLGNSITCSHISTIQNPPVGSRCRRRVEQYHLHTSTWSPAIDEDNTCSDSSASPYSLVHHIYTCSDRNYWNMGFIFSGTITPDLSLKPNLWTRVISM